jgi:hypothetical protein
VQYLTDPAPGARPRAAPRARTGAWAPRRLAAVALTAMLAGCQSTGVDILREVAGSRGMPEPDAAAVAASPHARLQVRGAGVGAVMVLGNDDDGRLSWYSDRRHIVFLRDGLLVGSNGLAVNADQIRIEGNNPFLRLAELGDAPVAVARRYDWRDGYRYGVAVNGQLQRRGVEPVEILGTTRQLVRFEETLSGPGVRARNEYWAEAGTGFIWKSRQLLAPGVSLEIVQLKPYRPGPR